MGPLGFTVGISLVAGDGVMQIDFGISPVPESDHDVPLFTLRARRRGRRQLSVGDAVAPVGIHRQRALAADLREAGTHPAARLAGFNAAVPCGARVIGSG